MRDVIRTTWFATMMFVVSMVGSWVAVGWMQPSGAWLGIMIVMLVTPPTWWWLIGRRSSASVGRGALAGAVCAGLICLVPIIHLTQAILVRGLGQGDGVVGIVAVAGVSIVTIPLGAVVGMITVLLQRQWLA